MNDDTTTDGWTGAPLPDGPAPTPPRQRGRLRRRAAGIATLTGLAVGGLAGGYIVTHAASASPSPSATAAPSGQPGLPGGGPGDGRHGGMGLAGNRDEDMQVVATAIGISASDLQTALRSGQTIAAVAKAHNVDVNKVIDALVASENKEVDDALAAGRITQAQAEQMKSHQQQRVTDMVNHTAPPGGHGGPGRPGLQGEDATLLAGVIGISAGDLQTALQNGQTIAAVAKAHNVDVNKVITAWVASENKEIDDRVSAGQITQAQADQMKQMTRQRITDAVNGTFRGPGGPGGHRGPGGPGMPGDGGPSA
jgi:hypothetical protein